MYVESLFEGLQVFPLSPEIFGFILRQDVTGLYVWLVLVGWNLSRWLRNEKANCVFSLHRKLVPEPNGARMGEIPWRGQN